MSRPKSDNSKGAHLHIRVTEEDLEQFKQAAARAERSLSNWAVRVLKKASTR